MRWISRPINWFVAIEAVGVLTTLVLHVAAFVHHDSDLRRIGNAVFAVTAVLASLPIVVAGAHAALQRMSRRKE
jgi:TRAP-type C4-dicarboxylate transport system permease large subunit